MYFDLSYLVVISEARVTLVPEHMGQKVTEMRGSPCVWLLWKPGGLRKRHCDRCMWFYQ